MTNEKKLLAYRMVRNYISAEIALAEYGRNSDHEFERPEDYIEAFNIMKEILTENKKFIIT